MQPPPRTTRSTANPGLVDRPSSRRSSAVVTQEKTKKKEVATLKTAELNRCAAKVNEVEREVRRTQVEAVATGQGGREKIVKKTFPRPDENDNVGSLILMQIRLHQFLTNPHTSLPPTQATKANQGKRDANSADLSELTMVTKVTRFVAQVYSLFGSLNGYRVTKSSSPRSSKDIASNKPSGLTGSAKPTIIPPTATTADEGDESSTSTEDEEVIDNLEFSTSSENSLV